MSRHRNNMHISTVLQPIVMGEWPRDHDLTLSARAERELSAEYFFCVVPVGSQQESIQQL